MGVESGTACRYSHALHCCLHDHVSHVNVCNPSFLSAPMVRLSIEQVQHRRHYSKQNKNVRNASEAVGDLLVWNTDENFEPDDLLNKKATAKQAASSKKTTASKKTSKTKKSVKHTTATKTKKSQKHAWINEDDVKHSDQRPKSKPVQAEEPLSSTKADKCTEASLPCSDLWELYNTTATRLAEMQKTRRSSKADTTTKADVTNTGDYDDVFTLQEDQKASDRKKQKAEQLQWKLRRLEKSRRDVKKKKHKKEKSYTMLEPVEKSWLRTREDTDWVPVHDMQLFKNLYGDAPNSPRKELAHMNQSFTIRENKKTSLRPTTSRSEFKSAAAKTMPVKSRSSRTHKGQQRKGEKKSRNNRTKCAEV